MSERLLHGCSRAVLATLAPFSFDACVTDPPYDLRTDGQDQSKQEALFDLPAREGRGFMGQRWDASGIAFDPSFWLQVYHVLKPGAHLVAFGGTRTAHRMICAIEDAGFEIRDLLMWIYGQGMPKSRNLDGDWNGWGTGLKPAWEPIVLARRPLSEPTLELNIGRWGVGALNIDGSRIEGAKGDGVWGSSQETCRSTFNGSPENPGYRSEAHPLGRWPANLILDEVSASVLDAQSGTLKSGANPTRRSSAKFKNVYAEFQGQQACTPARGADQGGASRFFYCSKSSRSERNAGLDGFEEKPLHWSSGDQNPGSFQAPGTHKAAQNYHPTVKPIDLCAWLCRLITPPHGLILDPFMGSGSTGCACVPLGYGFVGIEREAEFVTIASARIAHWKGRHGVSVPQP